MSLIYLLIISMIYLLFNDKYILLCLPKFYDGPIQCLKSEENSYLPFLACCTRRPPTPQNSRGPLRLEFTLSLPV